MNHGLLAPGIVSFVFTPLVITVALMLVIWWKQMRPALAGQSPVCGMLSVALPPLGLPFIYFITLMAEAIGGSPFTQSSRWSNPDAVMAVVNIIVKLMFFCLLAGLPLGLAGWLRRERWRWLSGLGLLLSLCIVGYFLVVMHLVAGGPHGD